MVGEVVDVGPLVVAVAAADGGVVVAAGPRVDFGTDVGIDYGVQVLAAGCLVQLESD